MCDFKKLCTCDSVNDAEDHWILEFRYGFFPGEATPTRPEHREFADKYSSNLLTQIIGQTPSEMFREIAIGTSEPRSLVKIIENEEKWLNEDNPFDFDFKPFEGDKLTFVINGNKIVFRFFGKKWTYRQTDGVGKWLDRVVSDAIGEETNHMSPQEIAIAYLQDLGKDP